MLRFRDWRYWDIDTDSHRVKLIATTGIGSYVVDTFFITSGKLREDRKKFEEYVQGCMSDGVPPHEAEFE